MISFIVIGRNEGWKLTKCFISIFQTIKQNTLSKYEVIYVDSKSTDDSIERAKIFKDVKIFVITGYCNAAIARNIGAKESSGDTLYFIDGDMELIPDFLGNIYNIDGTLLYAFLSGDYYNLNYNKDNVLLNKQLAYNNKHILRDYKTGGLFIIKREVWNIVDGMRNEFKRSQDFDLGLRLAAKGYFLYRLPIISAIHNTIAYSDKSRKWRMLFDKTHLWGRCYLYRKNIFNKYSWNLWFKQDYTLLLLTLILVVCLILGMKYTPFFLIYLFAISFRSIKRNIRCLKVRLLFEDFFYYLIRDITQIIGLISFFPMPVKNIKYIRK